MRALSPPRTSQASGRLLPPPQVNCCTIDWFSEWPQDALASVARSYLANVELQASCAAGPSRCCVEATRAKLDQTNAAVLLCSWATPHLSLDNLTQLQRCGEPAGRCCSGVASITSLACLLLPPVGRPGPGAGGGAGGGRGQLLRVHAPVGGAQVSVLPGGAAQVCPAQAEPCHNGLCPAPACLRCCLRPCPGLIGAPLAYWRPPVWPVSAGRAVMAAVEGVK
jgi:hypothetical protein